MRVDRPPPGEEFNPGEETPAREAASAIVLREASGGPEVLLVERNHDSKFMGGAWVFPGGSVREGDDGPTGAAARELEEEASVRVGSLDDLVPFSRWITPSQVKIRFDTWFFLLAAPADAEAVPDGGECVDARWLRPADALEAHQRDELMLVFPTIKHLEELAGFASIEDALAAARSRRVEPVQPRVIVEGDSARVLMPGEPGYDE